MKSASSFLFNAISSHPQVLQPVMGSQLKETYCYMTNNLRKLRKRMWCFPFIEESENFVTADGTVYYATDENSAQVLKADNPNMKAIFVLRHPVERLYSNYKFAFATFKKFGPADAYLNTGMNQVEKFGRLRRIITNATAHGVNMTNPETIDQFMNEYFRVGYEGSGPLGIIYMHSIYFPGILNFKRAFGEYDFLCSSFFVMYEKLLFR